MPLDIAAGARPPRATWIRRSPVRFLPVIYCQILTVPTPIGNIRAPRRATPRNRDKPGWFRPAGFFYALAGDILSAITQTEVSMQCQCQDCGQSETRTRSEFFQASLPRCTLCGGLLRPDNERAVIRRRLVVNRSACSRPKWRDENRFRKKRRRK